MCPRRPWILVSAALTVLAACGGEPRARPSVLLVSIDTLRADHLGCYGYPRNTSPRLDALARDGVLFESHISSSSWTLPAHAALFTSVPDSVHGCVDVSATALAPEFTTLAERFRAAGYSTAGFYAGPYLHPAFGLAQGFETYEACAAGLGKLDGGAAAEWGADRDVMRQSHSGVTNDVVYARARAWLEEARGEPFFCFVHFWDVHFDFVPPAPYDRLFDPDYEGDVDGVGFFFNERILEGRISERDREHLIALYDGEVRWTDEHLGKLLDDLEGWGLGEATVVAVTSDHGTELWDRGSVGHRSTLFDELIHVPLVLRGPGLPSGVRVEAQTRAIDVAPTLLQLARIAPARETLGVSLVPLARGKGQGRAALSELYSVGRQLRTVRTPEAKWVDDLASGSSYWFDLRADPGELEHLQEPGERQKRLLGARARMLREVGRGLEERPGGPRATELPARVLEALESNGYLGSDE